jgi:hypothetical protein
MIGRQHRIVLPGSLEQQSDTASPRPHGDCLRWNIAPLRSSRYNSAVAGLANGCAVLRRRVNCRPQTEWERQMEKKRAQSKQTKAEHEITAPNDHAELNRMAHRIAWTRMNGRNDALNPFAETEISQSESSEVQSE